MWTVKTLIYIFLYNHTQGMIYIIGYKSVI